MSRNIIDERINILHNLPVDCSYAAEIQDLYYGEKDIPTWKSIERIVAEFK